MPPRTRGSRERNLRPSISWAFCTYAPAADMGKFAVQLQTIAKRLGRGLKAVWEWCKQHRHDAVNEQQKTLNAKLRGHYQYYGRRTNDRAIRQFYQRVRCIWREWLSRRTRGKQLTWKGLEKFCVSTRCFSLRL